MNNQLEKKMHFYQVTVIFSVFFALVGFSYNVWRMEVSEENDNIRLASFEILLELSALEQLVYTAYYDHDVKEGSPRKGWVKVGLIADMSTLTTNPVKTKTDILKQTWSEHWETMASNQDSVKEIVNAIETVRSEIKQLLSSLQ